MLNANKISEIKISKRCKNLFKFVFFPRKVSSSCHLIFGFFCCVFVLQVALNEEISKQKSENDEVDDLKVEKVAGVAAWQDGDHAMADDYSKLDQLNYCYEGFDAFYEALNFVVVERAEEVVGVHGDMNV